MVDCFRITPFLLLRNKYLNRAKIKKPRYTTCYFYVITLGCSAIHAKVDMPQLKGNKSIRTHCSPLTIQLNLDFSQFLLYCLTSDSQRSESNKKLKNYRMI